MDVTSCVNNKKIILKMRVFEDLIRIGKFLQESEKEMCFPQEQIYWTIKPHLTSQSHRFSSLTLQISSLTFLIALPRSHPLYPTQQN